VPSPLPYFAASAPSVQLRLIALRAIADLIFVPPASAPLAPLPPPTTTPTHRSPPAIASLPGYPETLYLDHSRMILLSADAADLTAQYMLLMLYRQLVFSSSPKDGVAPRAAVTDAELQRVRKEIWEIGPSRLGYCFSQGRGKRSKEHGREREEKTEEEKERDRLKHEEKEKKEWKKWHTSMRDVMLQIAMRATTGRTVAGSSASTPVTSAAAPVPDEATVKLVERWADTNLRHGSQLSTLLRDKLRNAVLDVVIENVLKLPPKKSPHPDAAAPAPAATMSGLEPLAAEIKQLGERVAKLATIHLNVYGPLYESSGYMDAGCS
jgi:hypothetical protein